MFGSCWGNDSYATKGGKCFSVFSSSVIGRIFITDMISQVPMLLSDN